MSAPGVIAAAAAVIAATAASREPRPVRAACPCPDHPGRVLMPLPGGAARGTCPADGRSYQMNPPEVQP